METGSINLLPGTAAKVAFAIVALGTNAGGIRCSSSGNSNSKRKSRSNNKDIEQTERKQRKMHLIKLKHFHCQAKNN